jgi:hypothetical protein
MPEFDYLVVGGGTAGCIVAARLAQDPAVSVGLIEWGPSDEHEPRARSIRRWAEMLEGQYDLDYRSVRQERGNSGIRQARLRILGGCSTANTMISWRPRVADLREWAELGAAGWDAATVHPYFGRLQAPITPVPAQDQNPFVAGVIQSASAALGLPVRSAWNDEDIIEGTGFFEIGYQPQTNTRSSSSIWYLHPAQRSRANLRVMLRARALRLSPDAARPDITMHFPVEAWVDHVVAHGVAMPPHYMVKTTVTVFGENEVAAERPRGQRRRLPNHGSDVFGPRQRQHAERAGIRDRRGQPGNRNHGRQDYRLFDPEQLAHRCAHRGYPLLGSTYEVGIDPGDRRSQPWNFEKSPASQASRRPGVLRSQSVRISFVASRRSRHRS